MLKTEQKLKLLQMVREENRQNRARMSRRCNLLYGTSGSTADASWNYHEDDMEGIPISQTTDKKPVSGFKVRFILAAILFLSFFYIDRTGQSVSGVDSKDLVECISESAFSEELLKLFNINL